MMLNFLNSQHDTRVNISNVTAFPCAIYLLAIRTENLPSGLRKRESFERKSCVSRSEVYSHLNYLKKMKGNCMQTMSAGKNIKRYHFKWNNKNNNTGQSSVAPLFWKTESLSQVKVCKCAGQSRRSIIPGKSNLLAFPLISDQHGCCRQMNMQAGFSMYVGHYRTSSPI